MSLATLKNELPSRMEQEGKSVYFAPRRRLSARLLLFSVAALVGIGLTYFLGGMYDFKTERTRLGADAESLELRSRQVGVEAGRGVGKVANSPWPPCSTRDIAYLRTLIFDSEYLRDAGRIADGKLICSASLGRLDPPVSIPPPDIVSSTAGWRTWITIWPVISETRHGHIIEVKNIFVAVNELTLADQQEPARRIATKLLDDSSNHRMLLTFGPPVPLSPQEIRAGRLIERQGVLYQPVCRKDTIICVVVSESRATALRIMPVVLTVRILFGAMFGTLVATLFLLLDLRWRSLERQLRTAIRKGKLTLVYQPIVDLSTGLVASAETLVRWTKDNGESVSPVEFVTLAENRGFVGEITSLVLKRMVEELGDILREGKLRVTINTTSQDFTNGALLPELEARFAAAGIPHSVLGLELTERSTVSSAVASQSLPRFNEAGYKLYIDDFGTGYSSLGYLHTLTIDAIKIDRIFTQTVGTEAVTASVVPQILDMARQLNLQVVVEGIETEEQAEYFRNTLPGIQGQGWLFSRPLPAAEFRKFLANHQSAAVAGTLG